VIVLAVIVLVAVAVGVADHLVTRPAPAAAPPLSIATVPPAGVESSAWYCAGGMSASNSAAGTTLNLVNTTDRPVPGVMRAVGDTGQAKSVRLVVPAGTQVTEVPGPLVGGSLVAATFAFQGGGVLASESVAGPLGWSEALCSRSTASQWYFASGVTQKGDTLTLSLYNPTTTEAVVDTTFVTPSGISEPQLFEGIVVAPGQLVTEHLDAYVQDAPSVSSIIDVRTGSVVAAELQTTSGSGSNGLSVRLGVPALSPAWVLPRTIDLVGGTTSISVFNPSQSTDHVEVVVRPGSSPAARFTQVIGPRTTWVLQTTGQTRIPNGLPFLASVRVVSGPGVVVDRSLRAPGSAPTPQFGAATALAVGPAQPALPVAVLPGPGTELHPPVAGAAVDALNLVNTGTVPLRATVWALDGTAGRLLVATVTLGPGSTSAIGRQAFARVGRVPLVVSADQPVAVVEDLVPSASAGVVSLTGAGAAAP